MKYNNDDTPMIQHQSRLRNNCSSISSLYPTRLFILIDLFLKFGLNPVYCSHSLFNRHPRHNFLSVYRTGVLVFIKKILYPNGYRIFTPTLNQTLSLIDGTCQIIQDIFIDSFSILFYALPSINIRTNNYSARQNRFIIFLF